jgi:hypothetical protein
MKFAGFCLLTAVLLPSAGARAQSADTAAPAAIPDVPYASIVARNMFALVPIPPAITNADMANVDPPPKITPNGIMTIFGRDQCLFKATKKPQPGQQAKEDAYVLGEGERQDDIEVVKIDHLNSIITFNNHGTVQELPLVAAKDAGGPAGPAAGPGGPGGPRVGGMLPGAGARGRGGMAVGTPAQPARGGGMANSYNSGGAYGGNSGAYGGNGGSYGGNTYQAGGQQTAAIEDQVMNAARQMALIEQNRIATQDQVDAGTMPPLPPTLLTPPEATGNNGAPLTTVPPIPGK